MLTEEQEKAIEEHKSYLENHVRQNGCTCNLQVYCLNPGNTNWEIRERWVQDVLCPIKSHRPTY